MKKKILGLVFLGSFSLVGTTASGPMSILQKISGFRFDVFRRIHTAMHQKYAPLKKGATLPACMADIMLSADCLEAIQYLIDGGISVNTANYKGQTRLYTVHDIKLAELLLDNGAFLNIKDCNGQTPLHTVSNVDIARLFVDHGACLSSKDNQGRTPIDTAFRNRELVEFFSQCSIDSMDKE